MMNKSTKWIVVITIILILLGSILAVTVEGRGLNEDYTQTCEDIAEQYFICPELIEAIIESEPLDEGRVGVMHLDPKAHKDRMDKLNVTNLNDAKSNILVGTDYLLELFEKYEDPYIVISKFTGASEQDEMYVWSILNRSLELEKEHGKV